MHRNDGKRDFRILFLYAGIQREKLLESHLRGEAPDSSFFGLLQLQRIAHVTADFSERSSRAKVGFNASFLPLLSRIWQYDVVVSPVALPVLSIRSLLPVRKPAWIVFNLNLTNMLTRNRQRRLKYALVTFVLKRAAHIICLSESQKLFLVEHGFDRRKLSTIRFGIDKEFFKPTGDRPAGGYILSVGRDNGRDYETLCAAAKGIAAKFLIVCSPRNVEHIREIPENVEIRYDVDYLTLKKLYEGARFVIVPSRRENYLDGSDCSGQTVILDAMSAGKPVIATYRSWMDDYLSHGNDCIIIPPETPDALRDAIERMMNDEVGAMRMGTEARRRIETELNSENMAAQLYTICKAAIL